MTCPASDLGLLAPLDLVVMKECDTSQKNNNMIPVLRDFLANIVICSRS